MLDITKEALQYINSRSYNEYTGVINNFNMLIEYTLKLVPIVEDPTCETAQVESLNRKGFIIRYNPECQLFMDTDRDKHVRKVSWALAHEALHILLKHFSYKYDVEKDNPELMNIAEDSQVNSYLYKLGYADVYKGDPKWKHLTIVEIVEEYVEYAKEYQRYKDVEKAFQERSNGLVPSVDLSKYDDGSGIIDGLAPCRMKLEGIAMGFEKVDDLPNWEVMYEYLMKYCPKSEIGIMYAGYGIGNYHSEYDIEAADEYVDRIFRGFAKAVDRTIEELTEELQKQLNAKNFSFKMKPIKVERLKGEWVRTLSKHVNGVNAISSYIPTWSKFSRRLGEGYVGKKADRYQEVSVMVDVSGSMTNDIPRAIKQICEVATFIGRIKYFLTWDTEQCGEWKNINSKRLSKLEIGARGGTKLGEGFKQLAKHGGTKVLIIISDMETDEEDYKILNELSLTHNVILGLVQKDITLAYDFFNHRVKVIPIGGLANET